MGGHLKFDVVLVFTITRLQEGGLGSVPVLTSVEKEIIPHSPTFPTPPTPLFPPQSNQGSIVTGMSAPSAL